MPEVKLLQTIKPDHIAIICDGNRTWAKERGKPAGFGHKQGIKMIEELIESGIEQGIPYLTFWIFSTENWNRSKAEVSLLFNLFRQSFKRIETKMDKKDVRLNFIGDISRLPQDMQEYIERSEAKTKNNKRLTATFAISYGGRDEIVRAVNKYIEDKQPTTENNERLTPEKLEKYLDTYDLPEPDMIVRTGLSNYRLSGFLLWQLNYAELYFPNVGFPDFDDSELKKAVAEFGKRQRRFGK